MININRKITSNKTKYLFVENQFKKLETFCSIYFPGESHFEDDVTQNYLDILMVLTFIIKNLKDYLLKKLIVLKLLTMGLLHT